MLDNCRLHLGVVHSMIYYATFILWSCGNAIFRSLLVDFQYWIPNDVLYTFRAVAQALMQLQLPFTFWRSVSLHLWYWLAILLCCLYVIDLANIWSKSKIYVLWKWMNNYVICYQFPNVFAYLCMLWFSSYIRGLLAYSVRLFILAKGVWIWLFLSDD